MMNNMIGSIIQKEWLKLRLYIGALFVSFVVILGYFWFNLDFSFSTIEPESMMWYKFVHLGDKPYFYLSYLFISIGVVISFAQFLPERIGNRIKIMAHLPLSMRDSLFVHLFIGIVFIVFLVTIFSIILLLILVNYYPQQIVQVGFKDTLAYSFLTIVLYLGISGVILEKDIKFVILKSFLILLFGFVFLKEQYSSIDILWVSFLLFIPFVVLDSFYSIKQQRIYTFIYKAALIVAIGSLLYLTYSNYTDTYQKTFNKYYIFYSNIVQDFVYQKNFGDHRFEYGIEDKKLFDRITYESYLPFVYWKNLDIQGKLPLQIGTETFDKQTIKNSRFGLSYHPNLLTKQEVKLYPLFNPQKNKGVIKFPEEMFTIKNNEVLIYDYDNGLNKDLSSFVKIQLDEQKFVYPAVEIWGKATNMKPYDKGYLIQDSEKKLFNVLRRDDTVVVKEIKYPKGIDIKFIKISENKQQILSGYAIDTKSNFYLLSWDFKFIKLDLQNFDYETMKLKVISNPLNYLIRYDNGEEYYGVVFDKSYQKIKTVQLK